MIYNKLYLAVVLSSGFDCFDADVPSYIKDRSYDLENYRNGGV